MSSPRQFGRQKLPTPPAAADRRRVSRRGDWRGKLWEQSAAATRPPVGQFPVVRRSPRSKCGGCGHSVTDRPRVGRHPSADWQARGADPTGSRGRRQGKLSGAVQQGKRSLQVRCRHLQGPRRDAGGGMIVRHGQVAGEHKRCEKALEPNLKGQRSETAVSCQPVGAAREQRRYVAGEDAPAGAHGS